jgi:hypothetical protein
MSVANDQKLHCVNTSGVTKVVEQQQIVILETFKFKIGVLWATTAQKTKIRENFILLLNTLLGLNESITCS